MFGARLRARVGVHLRRDRENVHTAHVWIRTHLQTYSSTSHLQSDPTRLWATISTTNKVEGKKALPVNVRVKVCRSKSTTSHLLDAFKLKPISAAEGAPVITDAESKITITAREVHNMNYWTQRRSFLKASVDLFEGFSHPW